MSGLMRTKLLPIASQGNIASNLLWVFLIIHLIGIPIFILFGMFGPIKDGVQSSSMQIAIGLVFTVWSIVQFVAFSASGIACLVWLYRADKNLVVGKVGGLRFTPFWSSACWFIPLVNCVMPYRVVKEVFNASSPTAEEYETDWTTLAVPKIVPLWWGLTVADMLINLVSALLLESNLAVGVGLQVLCLSCSIGSAWLGIKIISEINHRQMHKFPDLKMI
jgi:hypothetical protein